MTLEKISEVALETGLAIYVELKLFTGVVCSTGSIASGIEVVIIKKAGGACLTVNEFCKGERGEAICAGSGVGIQALLAVGVTLHADCLVAEVKTIGTGLAV